ncbi:hypothetical protein [Mycobacterium sp. EPa45]|uniref:hypothetical protein n=1 Tax=Mycobacterium sp. EPa45 TaxID=1545728 RepID=UPI0006421453|nr:hypothetical protein [Mycobacterium sp. EPa45]AKK28207.1 hypothetical protein AB431_17655 [Mycobacterium sp. EPa45]
MTQHQPSSPPSAAVRAVVEAAHAAGHFRPWTNDTIRGVGVGAALDRSGLPWQVLTATAATLARHIADDYHGGPEIFLSFRQALAGTFWGDEERHEQQRDDDFDIGSAVLAIAPVDGFANRLEMARIFGDGDDRRVALQTVFLVRTLAAWAGPADHIIDDIANNTLKEDNR